MIPEQRAIEILKKYEGGNNYILNCKEKLFFTKGYKPSRSQADYIIKYHEETPKVARKWVDIDPYFGNKLREERLLPQPIEKIYIEKLLAQTEKAFHIYAKILEKSQLECMWVPKSHIMSNNERQVEVDWSVYSHRPPMEHQKEAILKLLGNDKYILADDMGLGKTTSAAIAAIESGAQKVLVICPASLKINWKREIENYSKEEVGIVEGKKWADGKFVIINYDIIKNFHEIPKKGDDEFESKFLEEGFDLVLIDEAHYISNKQAKRTQLVNHLVKQVGKVWLLTGTPMTSRPINYFNLLHIVDSPLTINWAGYVKRYCDGYQFQAGNRKVWNVNGASNLEELRDRTKPHVLRRLKEDILDLPDKIITPVYLNLKSKEYEREIGEYLEWENNENEKKTLAIRLSKLMMARQIIAESKLESTYELVDNAIEQGKKVIVFTNFTATLEEIAWKYNKRSVTLDGRMSKQKRQESVDKFQNDPKIQVFVGNIKAAGVGITLTAAEVVIFNDLSFVPSDHSQAEDRAYRFGQKSNVSVFYPVFENTIEMVIYDILQRKKNVIDTVMGDNEEEMSSSVMEDLLSALKNQ
jgi:SWI/SNF-related matrix-associated actin-dependent regulator of chromatin subfamily A-like protein 1